MNNLPRNLKTLRLNYGLSKKSIANYLGVQSSMINYYETGERNISLEHLEKLANLFGINSYDLLEQNAENQQIINNFSSKFAKLTSEDMNGIAAFQKVVRNYLNMKEISQR